MRCLHTRCVLKNQVVKKRSLVGIIAAFHQFAEADGLYARSINGDAFSKGVKLETIEAISKDLGQ